MQLLYSVEALSRHCPTCKEVHWGSRPRCQLILLRMPEFVVSTKFSCLYGSSSCFRGARTLKENQFVWVHFVSKVPFQPFLLVKSSHEKSKSTSSCLKIVLLTLLSSSMTRGSRSLLPSSSSTFCQFSIRSQCMSRLPTCMPLSCLRRHSVFVRPGGGPRVSYLCWALWDGYGECVCFYYCAREILGSSSHIS